MSRVFEYTELEEAPLIVGAIYKNHQNIAFGGNPLGKLGLLGQNTGGFRYNSKANYCTLTYSGHNAHWPDCVDPKSGIVHYYGDNHGNKDGKLLSTRGNFFLNEQFKLLQNGKRDLLKIFLIFEIITGEGYLFRGLGVMGMPSGRTLDCLQIIKATLDDGRIVENYHATLTILNVKELSRSNILDLNTGNWPLINNHCPIEAWRTDARIEPLTKTTNS